MVKTYISDIFGFIIKLFLEKYIFKSITPFYPIFILILDKKFIFMYLIKDNINFS